MAKYHINKESGTVGVCRAQPGNCRFGDDEEHFTSKDAAQGFYEKNKDQFTPIKKAPKKTKAQQDLEKAEQELKEAEEEYRKINTTKNKKMREFREAESKIQDGLLNSRFIDPVWHTTYEKTKVELEVLDGMLKTSTDKVSKAKLKQARAKQTVNPPRPVALTPAPISYYGGCGGGRRGC